VPEDPSTRPIAEHRRNNIDSLRLLAALAVLFAHCFILAEPGIRDPITANLKEILPLQRGISGQAVALFFIVSGYLVTASFARRSNLGSYSAARLLRILPALWVALIVTVLAATVITTLSPDEFLTTSTTWSYLAHNAALFELRDHLAEVFTSNPSRDVNISLWTLPLEFLMYVVVAVVGFIGLLRNRRLFNLAVVAAFAGYVLADGKLPLVDDRHGSELLMYFIAGAAFYVNRDLVTLRAVPAVALLAAAMGLSLVDAPWLHPAIIFAFAYFVLWLGFTRRIRLPNLAARGDLSYATYLYAAFVTQAWIWALGPFDPWLLTLATVSVTLPLAWLSWHLVESPALSAKPRVAARLSRRRRKATSPARA
jgi:peptidoglycan/LPS O-acetylase OafA/YrhL